MTRPPICILLLFFIREIFSSYEPGLVAGYSWQGEEYVPYVPTDQSDEGMGIYIVVWNYYSDVDPDLLYPDPEPQSLMNTDPDPGQSNH